MVLMLGKDQSFSLSAYVTTPGYQSIVPSGYLYKREGGQTYVTPLLPQFFYGADGSQLSHTWRQYIPAAGEQTILSRVAGKPEPLEEIYWRKVSDHEAADMEAAEVKPWNEQVVDWWNGLTILEQFTVVTGAAIGSVALGYAVYSLSH